MPLMKLDRSRSGSDTALRSGRWSAIALNIKSIGHPREVGADAVVSSSAAEAKVRVGVSQDVERVRVVEHILVEVRGPVEQHQPLPLLDRTPANSVSAKRGPLERGDR